MAVNPLLAQDGATSSLFPMPEAGEAFVLRRDNIDFECNLPRGGKLWGRGCFFLSSKRIVFVVGEKTCRADFKSFAIPLQTMRKPKFEQPIFGANYLTGLVRPVAGTETDTSAAPLIGGDTAFFLTFRSGGCNTFLPLLFQLLAEVQAQQQAQGPSIAQAAQEGRLNQVAYVDPSDPSVLYLSQPTAVPGTQERTPFEIENPTAPPAEGQSSAGGNNNNCVVS
eukprot:TRINITY_DN50216_c0_g1_i1.p2 TRINITY_DN50216_c0_g1~~TRINITY_DN50216_c0_g1_i1.p2  ORF type:complete len:223 (-),score=46.55 TRINITY_DN50216_c0_g1_i1:69-737(-)